MISHLFLPMKNPSLKTFYQRLFITLGMDESQIVFKDDLPLSESYHFAEASVTPIETQGDTSALHELSEEALAENAFCGSDRHS